MLTNYFEGRVFLRNTNDMVHEFIQTNYWSLLSTTFWSNPTVELAPGDFHRWEHSLADFIDTSRPQTTPREGLYHTVFPILEAEFQPGCEISGKFDVYRMVAVNKYESVTKRMTKVSSASLRFPE